MQHCDPNGSAEVEYCVNIDKEVLFESAPIFDRYKEARFLSVTPPPALHSRSQSTDEATTTPNVQPLAPNDLFEPTDRPAVPKRGSSNAVAAMDPNTKY